MDINLSKLFHEFIDDRYKNLDAKKIDFIHYTSAEVFIKIIGNKNIWLRNALDMNDTSELTHGRDKVMDFFTNSEIARIFFTTLDNQFPGISKDITTKYQEWLPDVNNYTYIFSMSEYNTTEHELGKLSMWRAYGRQSPIAIVVDRSFITESIDFVDAYTYPVIYEKSDDNTTFNNFCSTIIDSELKLAKADRASVEFLVFETMKNFCYTIKHDAFSEEEEWRVVYRPTEDAMQTLRAEPATIAGITQTVFKMPLEKDPIYINKLIKKVIIGPTPQPQLVADAVYRALCAIFSKQQAKKMITVSNIPFRG